MKRFHKVVGILTLGAALHVQAAEPLSGTLEKIQKSSTIVLGHRESSMPFSYYDDQQKPVGYSMDLCMAVVSAIKQKLGLENLNVRLQPVNSSNRIALVKNGTVDLECGSTANYVERQKEVAFSNSTFWVSKRFITKSDSPYKTIDDLKGKPVVVTQGTDTALLIRKINDERKLDLRIQAGKDHAESLLMVTTGRAAAFMEDDILVSSLRAKERDPSSLKLLDDSFGGDPYALMFRKDDPKFKAQVDSTLGELMSSGQATKLYEKWFLSPIPPAGITIGFPMPGRLKELFAAPSDKASS
jgi:glutamate/aspartate transport system substrate-binding protein